MRRSTRWLIFGGSAGVAAAAATTYGLVMRQWHLRWGATDQEFARPMPFDDLIADPNYFATRAITVDAPRETVWPLVKDTRGLPKGTIIRSLEEGRSIVFAPPEVEAEATWVVVLEPEGEAATRLISRTRARFRLTASAVLRYLLVDPAQFIVERRWLLDVKRRAERRNRSRAEEE